MITYVSKEIISDQVIKYGISGVLKVRFVFCKAQLVRTNFLYPYQMLSFYEIKSFTRNTDHEVTQCVNITQLFPVVEFGIFPNIF